MPDSIFDETWYLQRYQAVDRDIRAGLAADAIDHFRRLGRHRGYLPNAGAKRPANAAAYRSRFGGLWTDLANAHDLIEGKRQLGWIDDEERALLSHWVDNGFVKIPGAISGDLLMSARTALDNVYSGNSNIQLFHCVEDSPSAVTFRPYHRDKPVKALCAHWLWPVLRDAMFAPKISRFLSLIFERPALATQTLGFHRGSGQGGHQDSAYVGYTLQMQFAASWIALEDVLPNSGELFYYPESHRLDEFLYGGDFKNINELARFREPTFVSREDANCGNSIMRRINQAGLSRECFFPKAGDALIWSADLIHGGDDVGSTSTRRSLVTHYCPHEIAPLYFEQNSRSNKMHESGNYYTTCIYDEDQHVDRY